MTAAVQTMAYVGSTPWHSLGNKVEAGVTVDEMTKAAGIDWSVAKHPMFIEVDGRKVAVPNKAAVTREDTLDILSVSSTNWKPFQNKELMEFFREYVELGSATLETAGALRDGKIIWALANINKGFSLNGRDDVNGYVLLSNSHEPGASIRVMTTMVRVVCQNTLTLAHGKGEEMYRQSHVKDFDLSAAKATLDFARESVELHKLEAEALRSLELSAFDTVRTLAKHFQPEMANDDMDINILLANPEAQSRTMSDVIRSVVEAPGAMPDNAWGLLNGVTHWADHIAGKTSSSRLMNATFGRNAKIKLDVRKDLLQMADYQREMA